MFFTSIVRFVLFTLLPRLHLSWVRPAVPAHRRSGRRSRVLGHPQSHSEFEASLGYMRPYLKNQQTRVMLVFLGWFAVSLFQSSKELD